MKLSNLLIGFTIFLFSCGSKSDEPIQTKTDTLLFESDIVIKKAELSSKKIDSVTNETSEKLNDNIDVLNSTINNYKIQAQKIKSVSIKEKIIYKVDTVFIETKKNFWGKTKKSVSSVSDSSVNQTESVSDTTISE